MSAASEDPLAMAWSCCRRKIASCKLGEASDVTLPLIPIWRPSAWTDLTHLIIQFHWVLKSTTKKTFCQQAIRPVELNARTIIGYFHQGPHEPFNGHSPRLQPMPKREQLAIFICVHAPPVLIQVFNPRCFKTSVAHVQRRLPWYPAFILDILLPPRPTGLVSQYLHIWSRDWIVLGGFQGGSLWP